MRCHYEVFEIERNASLDTIKKQYKKLALRFHPDRNHGSEDEAAEKFKEVSSAYAVLSDPQERKWYDDHRDSILNSGNGVDESEDKVTNLWPFFTPTCYSGFGDSSLGFYAVYGGVFDIIQKSENSSSEAPVFLPVFGTSETICADVVSFYAHWSNFVTTLSFSWEDKYNPSEAPDRAVRRAIEKENKKVRDNARKEYNDQVRNLVLFVKKRDPRVKEIEEAAAKKRQADEQTRAAAKALEAERRRLQRERLQLSLDEESVAEKAIREEERSKAFLLADNDDSDYEEVNGFGLSDEAAHGSVEDQTDLSVENMSCDICSKSFKSSAQLEQHIASKVHRKKEQEYLKSQKSSQKSQKASSTKYAIEVNSVEESFQDLRVSDSVCETCGWTGKTPKAGNSIILDESCLS